MKNKLVKLRKIIDEIDKSIVNLLAKRMKTVKKIGMLKKQQNILPFDQSRWKKVLNFNIKKAESLGIDPEIIKNIYEIIHAEALKIEKKI